MMHPKQRADFKIALCTVLAFALSTADQLYADPLSDLIAGGTLESGDKLFSDFNYHGGGDMPAAEDIFVTAIMDADGNFGIRFQGAFVDGVGGGASDALIDFKVTAPEGKLIKDVHLAANPAVIGGDISNGLISITETFLPDNDQTVLSAYDIPGGERKLTNWADLVDENGELAPVQELHVQKDILVWTQDEGSAATMSFIDQAFSQCDDLDGDGACDVVDPDFCGDYNGDGIVSQADLDLVLLNWGNTVPPDPVPAGWINDQPSGVIGQAALDCVLLNWGHRVPSAFAAVPEPSSALLLAVGVLLMYFIKVA